MWGNSLVAHALETGLLVEARPEALIWSTRPRIPPESH